MIIRYADLPSNHITTRNVDVWIPDNLPGEARLPVVYMHDGQNLFDPACAYGGVDWGVDEAIDFMMKAGVVTGAIVVGVWNSALRWREYMPAKPMEKAAGSQVMNRFIERAGGAPLSEEYLAFLVTELKPFIDTHLPTKNDRMNTFVVGSSMGGLISAYAVTQYPQVFGGAACLSTHWPAGEETLVEELAALFPRPGVHRFYFDHGTATLDADYEPYQQKMDTLLHARGYRTGKDLMTCKFEGAEHNEAAWRKRLCIPLEFLLEARSD